MFDVIYFHAVMLVRYVMSLIKATYLLTYLLKLGARIKIVGRFSKLEFSPWVQGPSSL
jgi:hypothetical protein